MAKSIPVPGKDMITDSLPNVSIQEALNEPIDLDPDSPYAVLSHGHPVPKFSSEFNNYGHIEIPKEDLAEIQAFLTKEEGKCKCPPDLFSKIPDQSTRYHMAVMVDLYNQYEGDWSRVKRDPKSVSYPTLCRYWQDETFRACIKAYEDIHIVRAENVVTQLMTDDSVPPMVRLAAAKTYLEAKKSREYDAGVRKQIIANKGSLANTLFSKVVTQKDVLKTIALDPFSEVSVSVKTELLKSIGMDDSLVSAEPEIPVNADSLFPNKQLSDPFE